MGRSRTRSTGNPPDATPTFVAGDAASAAGDGLAAAQAWMGHWLEAAQGASQWLADLQRQGMEAATQWNEMFAAGAREAADAERIDQLLLVPANLARRQVDLLAQAAQVQFERLVDGQMQWLGDVNQQVAAAAQQALGAGTVPTAESTDLPEPWRQAMNQWQLLALGWLEPGPTRVAD